MNELTADVIAQQEAEDLAQEVKRTPVEEPESKKELPQIPADVVPLWVYVDFDPQMDDTDNLKRGIECLKDVAKVRDPDYMEIIDNGLQEIAEKLDIDFVGETNEQIVKMTKKEIDALKEQLENQEELEMKLLTWGMQLRQLAGFCRTPAQQLCRDIYEGIGGIVETNFNNVPFTGVNPDPPFQELDLTEKPPEPKSAKPDIGIWMEDPGDVEAVEQATVVSEYIKGVSRTKRM